MKITKNLTAFLFFSVFVGIAVLSLLPPKRLELGSSDKLSHFFAYFVLMLTYGTWRAKNRSHILIGITLLSGYGILLELLQGFIPGRVPSIFDVIANTSGVILGATALRLFFNRRS
ncbi:MAG: VanZ family protein [Bacteroidetes bacterium]|nr:VanZ family protein [Bacteroidota bacterium]